MKEENYILTTYHCLTAMKLSKFHNLVNSFQNHLEIVTSVEIFNFGQTPCFLLVYLDMTTYKLVVLTIWLHNPCTKSKFVFKGKARNF